MSLVECCADCSHSKDTEEHGPWCNNAVQAIPFRKYEEGEIPEFCPLPMED